MNEISKSQVIVKQILQISAKLNRNGNRIIKKYNLNQQQFSVLYEIVKKSTINQKQLSGSLFYEKANVSKIIKKLKSLDYINISSDIKDARYTILSPSKKGVEIFKECQAELNIFSDDWIKGITENNLDDIIFYLSVLNNR